MDTQHTPGPWIYARDFDENGKRAKVTTIAMCCDFVIGLPARYEGGNYRDGDPSGDSEADARLIAAAPELLEALKNLRREVVEYFGEKEFNLPEVDSAIAKATGLTK